MQRSHITTYSQPQDSKLNDTVTIITSVTNNQIVKSFHGGDYQPLKFGPGSEFLVSQHPVHGLHSLASVIGGLEAEPTKAVIRGLPLLPENEPVARQVRNGVDQARGYSADTFGLGEDASWFWICWGKSTYVISAG